MPFLKPTLTEIADRARADIDGRLPGADSRVRRSVLDVLARTLAGAVHGLYGYLDWVARQLFPDTADADSLTRWAAIWGVLRKASAKATGFVEVGGTVGRKLPGGARVLHASGVELVLGGGTIKVDGRAIVTATAAAPGVAANGLAGPVTFTSPEPSILAQATLLSMEGGADTETDDALRDRLLARIRRAPQGGARSDYERWALEVPAVTRVWVAPREIGAGTVVVRFVCDGRPSIIPTDEDVARVAAHLDTLRPVTADVTVVAPAARILDLKIRATPATDAVKAAIAAEIDDLLRREATPGGTILISHLREAVSIAAGETDHEIIIPGGDVRAGVGELLIAGPIQWT